jgi:hypothetical protein
VPVEDLEPSTKLAFFPYTPIDGDAPDVLADRVEFITLTYGDEAYRDAVRRAGFDGPILQYLSVSQVNGPGPYRDNNTVCDEGFEPLRNGIVRDVGSYCRDLHQNEDWFLHNGAGERLYSVVGVTGVWYHMNPSNPEWRTFASQRIARDIIGPDALGYDGLLLDNVELSLKKLTDQVENRDGTVLEFANDADYQTAWATYLGQIRASAGPETQLWANMVSDLNIGSTWALYLTYLDGAMSPAFATGYDGLTVAEWENNVGQAEAALANGKSVVAVGVGQQDDEALQTFALASYLLISDGESAYFRYMSNETNEGYTALWSYPNYEVRLGQPLGPRVEFGSTWRREFQCGYVEVIPANRTGSVVQTDCQHGTAP